MAAYPPVMDYLFLSEPRRSDTFMVEITGQVSRYGSLPGGTPAARSRCGEAGANLLFDVSSFLPCGVTRRTWEEGWLPILVLESQCGGCIKSLSLFAEGGELLVRCLGAGCDSCLSYPGGHTLKTAEWDERHARVVAFWKGWLASGLLLPNLHPRIDACWRSCLVQSLCACWGCHPKYGVWHYEDSMHDAFPPTILCLCDALRQFGHSAEARRRLSYYFNRFVRADGTLDYYGTALSEYGELLSLAASLSCDEEGRLWLRDNIEPVRLMLRHLMDCLNRHMHMAYGPHCLLTGSPEADNKEDTGEYIHINLLVLRGLEDILPRLATCLSPEAAMECTDAAAVLRIRIESALDSVRSGVPFLPYRMDRTEPVVSFTSDRDAAYANYRYYPEMLGSGILSTADARAIVAARRARGGDFHGNTVFAWPGYGPFMDNWPAAAYAKGLLELEEREMFMELLAGHFGYYQSPDTFTAYECIEKEGNVTRRAHSDWCVPVQLLFPRMLAWSYSYTKRDGTTLKWGGPNETEIAAILGKDMGKGMPPPDSPVRCP